MNDLGIGFRAAMFGGFQRDDVLKYIEETTEGQKKEVERLQADLEKSTEACKIAEDSVEKLTEANTALTAEAEALKSKLERLETSHTAKEQECTRQAQQITDLSAQITALMDEKVSMQRQIEVQRKENERLALRTKEYDAKRDHLAEIELGARSRAEQIEQEARQYADTLRAEAEDEADQTRREIERIKVEYRDTLRRTLSAVDEAQRYTAKIIDRFDDEAAQMPSEPIVQVDGEETEEQAEKASQNAHKAVNDILSSLRGKNRAEED